MIVNITIVFGGKVESILCCLLTAIYLFYKAQFEVSIFYLLFQSLVICQYGCFLKYKHLLDVFSAIDGLFQRIPFALIQVS